VHNHRHPRKPGSQTPYESGFGRVSVHDLVRFTPQEVDQTEEARQVPERSYVSPDDIQVHYTQLVLPRGLLEDRIGCQNVNLPTFRSRYLSQAQDNARGSTEAGIADNVQNSYRFRFFMGEHERRPQARDVDTKPFGVSENNLMQSG
jgi:hypothetical protein